MRRKGGREGAKDRGEIEHASVNIHTHFCSPPFSLPPSLPSANTLQLQSTKVYVYGLLVVGTAWMSSRIIWAINSVNSGYDVDVGPQSSSPPPSSSSNGTDSGDGGGGGGVEYQQMDRGELIYMVSLTLFLYSLVWGMCFLRASQFYTLVRRANGLGP